MFELITFAYKWPPAVRFGIKIYRKLRFRGWRP